MLPLKCSSSGPSQDTESEGETTQAPSSSISLASRNSTYNWRAALGSIGLVETAYLTYLKLSDSDAFCPLGGGSCGDVLNSDYAVIFGISLFFKIYHLSIYINLLMSSYLFLFFCKGLEN